jgi:hypothetical protein
MKLIPSSEVIQSVRGDGGEWEVRAGAEADYDESNSRVVRELESFLKKSVDERSQRGPPAAVAAWQEPRDRTRAVRRSQPGGARCFREFGSQSRPSLHP